MVRCPSADAERMIADQEAYYEFACRVCPFYKLVWGNQENLTEEEVFIIENYCESPKKCYQILSQKLYHEAREKGEHYSESNEHIADMLDLTDEQKAIMKDKMRMTDIMCRWDGVHGYYNDKGEWIDPTDNDNYRKDMKEYKQLRKKLNGWRP